MFILGLALLIIGFVAAIKILVIAGIVLLVLGGLLLVFGRTGRYGVGPRGWY